MKRPRAPHRARDIRPAYQLRYGWTGWPKAGTVFPAEPEGETWNIYEERLKTDGIRVLKHDWSPAKIQIVVSAKPNVAPTTIAQRIKGRLSYELGQQSVDIEFSRKTAVCGIGETHRKKVTKYVESQVDKRKYVSEAFANHLRQFGVSNETVDLSAPVETRSGRYWCGLHLVLVTDDRWRVTDREGLGLIKETCVAVANKHGHRMARLSVLPDHLHMALKPSPAVSPKSVGMSYLNNLCHRMRTGLWQAGFYVGAFGEYDMNAVREE